MEDRKVKITSCHTHTGTHTHMHTRTHARLSGILMKAIYYPSKKKHVLPPVGIYYTISFDKYDILASQNCLAWVIER